MAEKKDKVFHVSFDVLARSKDEVDVELTDVFELCEEGHFASMSSGDGWKIEGRSKAFPITSVHRDDIACMIHGSMTRRRKYTKKQSDALWERLVKKFSRISDSDMEYLARKMADAYVEHSFWADLGILAEDIIKEVK